MPTSMLCAGWLIPLQGQTRMNFNMGGGVSTPLNPTGAYAGVSANFNMGAGYALYCGTPSRQRREFFRFGAGNFRSVRRPSLL